MATLTGSALGAGFADPATLDPAIPTPQSVFGYEMGADAVRYEPLVRYLQALADASPLVTLQTHGSTHEGRTLYHLTITSEANHSRLAQIQADNARLHDPRGLAAADGDRIVAALPGIAWMAYSIHGDELSSTDAAVQLAYQLAAGTDAETVRLRDELVIHIDPLMNPDGRERFLAQLQHLRGKVTNTDHQAMHHRGLWSAGRGNHYLFDMNRDWLMQVHPETRGRSAVLLAWHPHLLVDSHEMGTQETYLMEPPREPVSGFLPQSNRTWRKQFSREQAASFDRRGWSYYTQEWYEDWYPGYTNAWSGHMGAIGLLYEQGRTSGHAVKQEAGNVVTYRDAVDHQLTSSIANLETLRANRREILRDFLADRRWAVSAAGPMNGVFLMPPNLDAARARRFAELLTLHGIEYRFAQAAFSAQGATSLWGETTDTREFPAGTMIVRSNQPHRRLMHANLAFDPRMSDEFLNEERKDIENRRGTRVYDVTGWNLPMAYGLDSWWAEQVAEVATTTENPAAAASPAELPAADFGYLIDGASADIHRAVAILLNGDHRIRAATKPFTIGGRSYAPSTILLRNNENGPNLAAALTELGRSLPLDIRPTDSALCETGPDLGGIRYGLLQRPRVAIASQYPISTTSFGAVWHLLDDRIGLRCSPINVQNLGSTDLRAYNVLILPDAGSAGALKAVLGDALEPLQAWIRSGGTLIAWGDSAAVLASEEMEISSVRLKRDVLDDLPAYEAALRDEDSARSPQFDPTHVWQQGLAWKRASTDAEGATDAEAEDEQEEADEDEIERLDKWQRLFNPEGGALVAARLNPEHWLCSGLGERLPVLLAGSHLLMSKEFGTAPVRLAEEPQLRLSGLLWPEYRARAARTAYATVERVGKGQVILFVTEPCFRGYHEGSARLLLNAVLLGPGLGTDQPVPW
jgi:hypothetical protein